MENRTPTIHDVAVAAGVPVFRVRKFFERPRRLRRSQRDRIAEAVRVLGFDYSGSGQHLRTHYRVAIISPYSTIYSFSERISGIITALDPDEYSVLTFNVENLAQYHRYLDFVLLPGAVDGVVVMALPLAEETIETFRKRSIPLVSIERDFPGIPSITIDNVEASRQAARFLVQRKYRRPAFMGDSAVPKYAFPASKMRFDGFREGLEESGVPLPDERIFWHPPEMDSVSDLVAKMMKLPQPPDAIFCASDTEALSVMRTTWNLDLKVPGNLAVLGFDNLAIAGYVGLSSVDQFLMQSGRDAAGMLEKMIRGIDRTPADILYESRIKERWST